MSLLFAGFAYVVTLVSLLTFIGFVSGVGSPVDVNTGPDLPVAIAMLVNVGLVLLWGVQHSVMARAWFKEWWIPIVGKAQERAAYCLASGMALLAVCLFWVPIDGVLWSIEGPGSWLVRGLALLGWAILLGASFEIDHFELFGVKQAIRGWRDQPDPVPSFQTHYLYRLVRHPIQLGVLMGVWLTPHMTVGHLMCAVALTVYIEVGLYFEERALVREFGPVYEAYRQEVPKLLPWPRPSGRRAAGKA